MIISKQDMFYCILLFGRVPECIAIVYWKRLHSGTASLFFYLSLSSLHFFPAFLYIIPLIKSNV